MQVGFKTNTIEKIIKNKINNWAESIKDDELKQKVLNDYIVTGGAITSMLLGEQPNDFDVYFHTPSVAKELADYYINQVLKNQPKNSKIPVIESIENNDSVKINIKSSGVLSEDLDNSDYDYFEQTSFDVLEKFLQGNKKEKPLYSVALITDNAITLHGNIQIIIRFCGTPEFIHSNFDYVHTTNYYTPVQGLQLNLDAVTATMSKTLTYMGSKYPICTLFRLRKFLKRGWSITGGEILKISWDISKLDLNNISVLREQLIGVDTAYFSQLIQILTKSENLNIDRTYLYNLIDRIFNDDDKVDGLMTS